MEDPQMDPLKTNSDISQKIRKNTKLAIHPIHSCVRIKSYSESYPTKKFVCSCRQWIPNGSFKDELRHFTEDSQKYKTKLTIHPIHSCVRIKIL